MKKIKLIVSAIFALFLLSLMFSYLGIGSFFEILSKLNLSLVLILFCIYIFDWVLRGYRWKSILSRGGFKLSLIKSTLLSVSGNFANLIIPAKLGDLVWIYGAKKQGVSNVVAITSVILDRFCDFIAVIMFLLVSMFFLTNMVLPLWIYYSLYVGMFVIVVCFSIIFFLVNHKLYIVRYIRIKKLERIIDKVSIVLSYFITNPFTFIWFIVVSCVVWLLETLIAYIVAVSFDVQISYTLILFAVIVANLTKIIPLTPGDLGVYEVTLATVLAVFGVDFNTGLLIALVDHIIKIFVVILLGGISSVLYGIKFVTKRDYEK